MYDWFEQNGYGDEIIEPVDVRWLCEQDAIVLKPGQLYYFEVKKGCGKCEALAAVYGR